MRAIYQNEVAECGYACLAMVLSHFGRAIEVRELQAFRPISANGLSLMDLRILQRYWQVRRSAFAVSLVATAGVILLGVLQGIVVAVVLAIMLFFRRNWWPHGAILGKLEGDRGWHDVATNPDAEQIPGVVVYRWEAPLFFANAGSFKEQIRKIVRERKPRWVVLQCEAITDVDVTAAEMLEQLDNELNTAGTHLAFAEMRGRLQDLTLRYGLLETLDHEHFYPTLDAALEQIQARERAREGAIR